MTDQAAATAPPTEGPPPGWEPLFRSSAFLDLTGPWYFQKQEQGFLVGLRIATRHVNSSGSAHGGLIATLADIALGYVTATARNPPLRMVTTSQVSCHA